MSWRETFCKVFQPVVKAIVYSVRHELGLLRDRPSSQAGYCCGQFWHSMRRWWQALISSVWPSCMKDVSSLCGAPWYEQGNFWWHGLHNCWVSTLRSGPMKGARALRWTSWRWVSGWPTHAVLAMKKGSRIRVMLDQSSGCFADGRRRHRAQSNA